MLCGVVFAVGIAVAPLVIPVLVTLVRSLSRVLAPSSFCTNLGQVAASVAGDSFSDTQAVTDYQAECAPPYGSLGTWLWLVGVLLAIAVVIALFRVPTRLAHRPLRAMTDTVRGMGPQNLGQRVRATAGRDEFGELARSVNDMLGRVAVGFEGQRRFAANASHELRTPLAVQRTLVEVAMVTGEADQGLRRLGAELLLVNERNEQLIEGLLVLAESDRGLTGTIPVRLDELTAAVLDAYTDIAAQHQVDLVPELRERTVQGDPVLLERLLGNLIHNAIKYNRPQGWVRVTVAERPTLVVHNCGQQVPAHLIGTLFEPFRRLRADRLNPKDGAGLGLSIVRSITAAHNGTVRATDGGDGGLRISIDLPSTDQEVVVAEQDG